jgi:hypothetical protein
MARKRLTRLQKYQLRAAARIVLVFIAFGKSNWAITSSGLLVILTTCVVFDVFSTSSRMCSSGRTVPLLHRQVFIFQ